jgi:hypothetical protein
VGHRGGEVKLQGSAQKGRRRIIVPIDPRAWRWRGLFAVAWQREAHINPLKMAAYRLSLRWRLRKAWRHNSRFLHLLDSQVCIAAATKGRTSSRQLRVPLAQVGAAILAGGLLPILGFTRTHLNPADKPSRQVGRRGVLRSSKRPRRARPL